MSIITIALAKGRLADETITLLEQCGINCDFLKVSTRKLILESDDKQFKFIFVKPADVPTYIERGVADIGFVGKDTIMEEDRDIYEMADLKFGACKMCIAGFESKFNLNKSKSVKVASKYSNITKKYFMAKGISIDLIKLTGSVELAPIIGLSDIIVDIVESGKTLHANGLIILETICEISARLVVNKTSLKTNNAVLPLINKIKAVLRGDAL